MSKAPMPRAIEPTAIYSVKECAYLTATHPDTFRKKLQRRIVKGSRLLGDWRVRGSELLRLA